MNVFVLCAGRCGSHTFWRACQHIENYTSGHEVIATFLGSDRVNYPDNHIEIDNRLSWHLGRLGAKYGDDAYYVHLRRDKEAIARSRYNQWFGGIIQAYQVAILERVEFLPGTEMAVCLDYVDCVTENIEYFLRGKTKKQEIWIENPLEQFEKFWENIGAKGNLEAALNEFNEKYAATKKWRDRDAASIEVSKRKTYYGV